MTVPIEGIVGQRPSKVGFPSFFSGMTIVSRFWVSCSLRSLPQLEISQYSGMLFLGTYKGFILFLHYKRCTILTGWIRLEDRQERVQVRESQLDIWAKCVRICYTRASRVTEMAWVFSPRDSKAQPRSCDADFEFGYVLHIALPWTMNPLTWANGRWRWVGRRKNGWAHSANRELNKVKTAGLSYPFN